MTAKKTRSQKTATKKTPQIRSQPKSNRKIESKSDSKSVSKTVWEDKETFLIAYPQTKEKYARLELFSQLPDHKARVIWLNRVFGLGLKQS